MLPCVFSWAREEAAGKIIHRTCPKPSQHSCRHWRLPLHSQSYPVLGQWRPSVGRCQHISARQENELQKYLHSVYGSQHMLGRERTRTQISVWAFLSQTPIHCRRIDCLTGVLYLFLILSLDVLGNVAQERNIASQPRHSIHKALYLFEQFHHILNRPPGMSLTLIEWKKLCWDPNPSVTISHPCSKTSHISALDPVEVDLALLLGLVISVTFLSLKQV